MTSRAHQPAEPGLPEVLVTDRPGVDLASPEVVSERMIAERVSSEVLSREAAAAPSVLADEDADEEEVSLEADALEAEPTDAATASGGAASGGAAPAGAEGAADSGALATADEAERARVSMPLPAEEDDPAELTRDASERLGASPADDSAEASVHVAGPAVAANKSAPPGPLAPDAEAAGSELTASEIAAFAELSPEPLAEGENSTGGAGLEDWTADVGEPRAARRYEPPWVDELPDPVTPYEQRVSETIKVADLPPVEQLLGRVLANRYLAEEVAEHTATSISYRAYHLALDLAVTVRILPRGLACTDDACQEVRRIAGIASSLEHAHVATSLDFGVLSDGWPFVVTEHFQGRTLASLVAAEGKFVLRRVLHIGKQIAAGLSAAHDAGLIHGLLNPDNVLVVDPGSSAEVAKILGFGISMARGPVPGPPRSGVFGVPFYVSPEQASCRPLDARSDIYSLGVILYELMAGSPPFSDGDFAGVLCQHLDDNAAPPSSRLPSPGALAKAMDAIIERCLRKDASKRYQSAAEVRDDLARLEAAAARTKRRPMPEVKRPTTTIHSPHPKAEGTQAPGAKVIVHGDVADASSPPGSLPEPSSGRRGLPPSSPRASQGSSASPIPSSTPTSPAVSAPVGSGSRAPISVATAPVSKAPRARTDQATVKISAFDRDLVLAQRPNAVKNGGLGGVWKGWASGVSTLVSWLRQSGQRLVGAVRRFIATAQGRDGSGDP